MTKIEWKDPNRGDWRGGAFSAGVEVDGWVYLSGHGAIDVVTGEYRAATIEEETAHALRNLLAVLQAAGCGLDDVVKVSAHLADMEDFRAYNRAYREFFKDVAVLPVRTTVQSIMWGGMKVEIDAIARKSATKSNVD